MSPKATIYDVAAEAGVSISTVSLALNRPQRVSRATLDKVLAAADKMGFTPKADAVTRARRGTGRVGVIAPFTSYPSFGRRLNGVLEELGDQQLEVVVFNEQSAATSVSPLLSSLPITGRVDGLIVMALPLDEGVASRLRDQGLPIVVVDVASSSFDLVTTDDYLGGQLVASHLLDRGHKVFGFVRERQESNAYVSAADRRLAGFKDTIVARGQKLPAANVQLVHHGTLDAQEAVVSLLKGKTRPTAIFAHDDTLALGALRAARELGIDVPRELAIVGFDDSEVADAVDLTTVRQPFEQSGRAAAQLMVERLQSDPTVRKTITLGLELVVRGTS